MTKELTFPQNIQIETTTICPASCIMCPQKLVTRPKLMPMETIDRIIAECAGRDVTIIPHQMGDALADPRIVDILKKCKDKKLKILMSTSGVLLDKKMSKELLDIGVDVINVSLDSLDEKTYVKIRKLPFDKVIHNLQDLVAMKRPTTKIWISAVDMFFNKKTRFAFQDFWKHFVDKVQITPYVQYPKVKDRRLPRKKAKDARSCERLETDMVILSNGEASKCCIDFEGLTSFGNVNDKTISLIWNGPERKVFLEKMKSEGRKSLDPCRICVI